MDAIEIFFTFYGVLLALATSRLVLGAARLLEHRKTIRIGWLTPLLILLLLFDLASFVTGAWRTLGVADVSFRLVFVCLLAAAGYGVAAVLVVPTNLEAHPDLDAWFAEHKRYAVGGILAANLFGFEVVQLLIKGSVETLASRWTGFSAVMNLLFYALVVLLLAIRNKVVDLVMLITLNALYFVVLVAF